MSNTLKKLDQLSPQKRALLELLLRERGAARAGDSSSSPPIPRRQANQPAPLSFAQQRLWFLNHWEPGAPVYNVCIAACVRGPLNIPVLERSLNAVVQRHEILRTTFSLSDGQPVQVVKPAAALKPEFIDLSAAPESGRQKEAVELLARHVHRPFDLSTGPLVRVTLVRTSDAEHYLSIEAHHIIGDGWGVGVFLEDLTSLYEAFGEGRPSPLAPLPIQYGDFAQWQRERLQGSVLDRDLQYWRKQLEGLATTDLPTDRPRPSVQTNRGSSVARKISPELYRQVKDFNKEEKVTPFMTLVAAFQVLMSRHSGESDVAIGTPIAGRTRLETERLIGLFTNTLVLRSNLSANPTVREFLQQVKDTALAAYAHQEIPFEKLVQDLRPPRDASRPPFFQVMFVLQNHPLPPLRFAGLHLTPVEIPTWRARFDLTVEAVEADGGLSYWVEYNSDLFDRETIERFMDNYERLLEEMVRKPLARLSELNLLSEREREEVLEQWNRTEQEYEDDACVHELIERQVAREPQRIALEFGERRVCYSELNENANRLAHYLRRQGLGPGSRVGVCLERGPQLLQALLAVWKAGAAYVPLDPQYPAERLALMLDDAAAAVVLTESLLGERLKFTNRRVLVDQEQDAIAGESAQNPERAARAGDLAYLIYTSGSTGRPKGVMIEHRAVVNFLESMRREPGLHREDRLLAVTTISFDIAVLELYLPLVVGARVILATREDALDGARLAARLRDATVMQATPASWRLLLESGWAGQSNLKALCGGEALPRELAERLLECCGELWNLYGPTETTVWSTLERVQSGEGNIRIGRPIANTQVYVLDENRRAAPAGVVGEIYIGGAGLARGYWGLAQQSAERFIEHPYRPGQCLYRTGDRGRWRREGKIECLGRQDHQVKLRGFRIELGEIESRLGECPGVKRAVVAVRQRAGGDQQLVAYLVAEEGQTPAASRLREQLQRNLPEYMIPSAYVALDVLPLTPNGKVDRRALPSPDQADVLESAREYVPPRNRLEELLQGIWAGTLNRDRVGVKDNFFDLGGHSLLMAEVQSKVSKALSREVTVPDLFRYPTIRSLAAFLNAAEKPDLSSDQARQRAARRLQSVYQRAEVMHAADRDRFS